MQTTDSIADMLTRIRNASSAKHDSVKIPASNMKKAIAQILVDEGYIKGFKVEDDGKQGMIEIALKYGQNTVIKARFQMPVRSMTLTTRNANRWIQS